MQEVQVAVEQRFLTYHPYAAGLVTTASRYATVIVAVRSVAIVVPPDVVTILRT